MNLVKMITDQLSGDALGKLSSVLGTDSDTARSAASAAVPTLLSGLANLAGTADGARRVTNVLGGIDTSSVGNLANMLSGDTGTWLQKGTSWLTSLFGDNLASNMASAIGSFTGLSSGISKNLMGYLLPLVLGKVAGQWKAQGGTASALTSMFADQQRNIADALPTGYDLADIPGLAAGREAVRAATYTTRRAEEAAYRSAPSLASWLLPLALLVAGGILLWNFLRPREQPMAAVEKTAGKNEQVTVMKPALPDAPAIPSVSQLTDDLNATFRTMGETIANIKDPASADAAAPKLEELSTKIDNIKAMMANIPEAGRATLQAVVDEQLKPMKEQAQRTLTMPGLSERIKTLLNEIIRKLDEWNIIETNP